MSSHPDYTINSSEQLRDSADSADMEKGLTAKVAEVSSTEAQEDRETRPAKHINWGDAIVDVLVAILPLYFVGFCAAAYIRNDTLANTFRNQAILQMSKFNPTIFPILFTLIFAKFIKACANWKLERGATVGSIQHLLGSRTLVSSIFTPIKLRTISLVVPVLVMVWACNPLGGQLSLRAVSSESNITTVDTPYLYIDPLAVVDTYAQMPDDFWRRVVDVAFTTALNTPVSSKNGTQDVFGNVQIPMLEYLQHVGSWSDADGWFYTGGTNLSGIQAAIAHAADFEPATRPIYTSLLGMPFKANLSSTAMPHTTNITQLDEYDRKLALIKQDLFGPDVVNTALSYSVETSYMYTNCSFAPLEKGPVISFQNYTSVWNTTQFDNSSVGVVRNQGFHLSYDGQHSLNSTAPRQLGIESWIAGDMSRYPELGTTGGYYGTLSKASCALTTTYVEAQVYCVTSTNCTVAKIRESRQPHNSSALTALDGMLTTNILTGDTPEAMEYLAGYQRNVSVGFFERFVSSTGTAQQGPTILSPLESYFASPASPYKASLGQVGSGSGEEGQQPIHDVGDEVFSYRLSQLINTYWATAIAPFELVNGISLEEVEDSTATTPPTTIGKTYVEKIVLRCHIPYMALLLVISIGLFGMGITTAYLDATRKGPDVLDSFVNSLRHNPYVHTDKLGPSMEDGEDMARRLKNTVVQMGDVKPDSQVGYVAIGTPMPEQPMQRLDHRRHYL